MATDYISPWGGMPRTGTDPLYGYSSVPDAVKKHFANYMSSGGMNVVYQDPQTGLYWQAQNTLPGGEGGEPGNQYGGYRVYQPSWDGGFNWQPGAEGTGYDLYKEDGSYGGSEGFNKPSAQRTWNLGLASVASMGALSQLGALGGAADAAGGTAATGAGEVAAGTGAVSSPVIGGGAGAVTTTQLLPAAAGGGLATGAGAGAAGGLLEALKTGAKNMTSGSGGFNWTDLIGPATQLVGGYMGSQAAEKASDSQLQAAREAMALNEPFRQGGMKGMNRLLDVLGISDNTGAAGYGSAAKDFSMADFQADPGYAFRQGEGEKALQRAASAGGLLGSGKYLKDSMKFNQDLASTEYGNAFNRFQTQRASKLNPLQSLMGAGQTAAGTVGEYRTQAGNAQAGGAVGSSNAWMDALGQGYSMYAKQRQQNQNNALTERILASRGY